MREMRGLKFWTDGFDKLANAQGDLETIWEFYEMGEATEAEVDAEGEKLEANLEALEFRIAKKRRRGLRPALPLDPFDYSAR